MANKRAVKWPRPASEETFSRWDPADHLKTRAKIVAYLDACMDEAWGDPGSIAAALGDIARARGMARLAKETVLTREGLYKSLAPDGNPSLGTIPKVMRALVLKLSPKAA